MNEELKGRVIIITGAGRGIGRAIAHELAEAGARLVLVARSQSELAQVAKKVGADRAAVVLGDVAEESTAMAAVARALQWGGRLDAVVNNAGVGWRGPTHEMPIEAWRHLMDVNLTAVFLFTRAALPHMLAQGRGHIVNISSGAGRLGAANIAAYCASKFAVDGFSQSVGAEVRASGVKVTVIEPGEVHTTFSERTAQADWGLQPADIARTVREVLATRPNVWLRQVFVTPLFRGH